MHKSAVLHDFIFPVHTAEVKGCEGLEKAGFLQTSLGGVSLQTGCWLVTVVIKPASWGLLITFI